ncbi:Zn-ribbon domain-containing OB-fold protein [Pseudohoeflea coraliihabitans]|uniref:ChsH2 rubredoxin-like zinc ribbon domain-containing protein n=1 Tax=Pseudohoeflea coraliihabitans TaxID=2860393 RepID=A0ABS6WQR3_9HYPH|nr:zinc ribbon domain-containing protein [Pseudohoeflea sp. DP4N28-3]MBW3098312.1 hypothetical protein [Pseudohoeflea sp. DP4N28-3]
MSSHPDNPQAGDDPLVARLQLNLDYTHGFGRLSPFFKALAGGRALASRCPACGDVRFPPRRLCLHDGAPTETHDLAGTGTIMRVTFTSTPIPPGTTAADEAFAEIAMHGADNRVLARLAGSPDRFCPGTSVVLHPPAGERVHPIQALVFEPNEGTDNVE